MEELTIIEQSVLELIPRGFERKIKVPDVNDYCRDYEDTQNQTEAFVRSHRAKS